MKKSFVLLSLALVACAPPKQDASKPATLVQCEILLNQFTANGTTDPSGFTEFVISGDPTVYTMTNACREFLASHY